MALPRRLLRRIQRDRTARLNRITRAWVKHLQVGVPRRSSGQDALLEHAGVRTKAGQRPRRRPAPRCACLWRYRFRRPRRSRVAQKRGVAERKAVATSKKASEEGGALASHSAEALVDLLSECLLLPAQEDARRYLADRQKTPPAGDLRMYVLRGPPGLGKSTYAERLLADAGVDASIARWVHICSTDFFFTTFHADGRQTYTFHRFLLGSMHEKNMERVKLAAKLKVNPIIVDNTATTLRELEPYESIANSAGYTVEVVEPWEIDERWNDIDFLEERNAQRKAMGKDIDIDTLQRMVDRFQPHASSSSSKKRREGEDLSGRPEKCSKTAAQAAKSSSAAASSAEAATTDAGPAPAAADPAEEEAKREALASEARAVEKEYKEKVAQNYLDAERERLRVKFEEAKRRQEEQQKRLQEEEAKREQQELESAKPATPDLSSPLPALDGKPQTETKGDEAIVATVSSVDAAKSDAVRGQQEPLSAADASGPCLDAAPSSEVAPATQIEQAAAELAVAEAVPSVSDEQPAAVQDHSEMLPPAEVPKEDARAAQDVEPAAAAEPVQEARPLGLLSSPRRQALLERVGAWVGLT